LPVAGITYQSYVVYICVFNGDPVAGISELEFGLDYNGASGSGMDVIADQTCSDLIFASNNWPGDGSSVTFTWDYKNNCQTEEPGGAGTGVTAVAAALRVFAYSPDRLSVVPKPTSGFVDIADCSLVSYDISAERRGSVVFSEDGSEQGNPGCTRASIEDATWGEMKKTYNK